jgi:hypothetical protein
MSATFIHHPLNQEITAIGGYYLFTKEVRLAYHGKELLYRVGCAAVDRSCCGIAGFGYALVPGFITGWHTTTTREGLPVSLVSPIEDPGVRKDVETLIKKKEMVQQVRFS